ncbi:hypothetical protein V6N12_076263 [Hibiscus sabdariffa]|uniref:Uncharacterized protein n=1 Tax=Hibiscus sabdariffa TaxID=183260 RepID=A0ABR2AD79_9ROSI
MMELYTMVAYEHFIVSIRDNLRLDAAAPLVCAGNIVYSPLRFYGFDKLELHVGVAGLGGLGHLAVKFEGSFGKSWSAETKISGFVLTTFSLSSNAFLICVY